MGVYKNISEIFSLKCEDSTIFKTTWSTRIYGPSVWKDQGSCGREYCSPCLVLLSQQSWASWNRILSIFVNTNNIIKCYILKYTINNFIKRPNQTKKTNPNKNLFIAFKLFIYKNSLKDNLFLRTSRSPNRCPPPHTHTLQDSNHTDNHIPLYL